MVLQLTSSKKASAGFTLVELLAVMAIMVLILAAAGAALAPSNRALDLTSNSAEIKGLLDQGRQFAIAHNRYVQVRFYEKATEPGYYTAIGLFASDSPYYSANSSDYVNWTTTGAIKPVGPIYYLSSSMAIPAVGVGGDASTFLGSDNSGASNPQGGTQKLHTLYNDTNFTRFVQNDTSLQGGHGQSYNWIAFYYMPNGSTDFQSFGDGSLLGVAADPTQTFFTLVMRNEFNRTAANNKLPSNFTTFVMPPATGRPVMLRP